MTLPLLGLLLQVPPATFVRYLSTPLVTSALRLTAISTGSSLLLMVILGTPVAYRLGRGAFRGKKVLETLLEVPLVLPPAVAGVALLFAFGRRTALAGLLREVNIEVAFTLGAVILAQTFVAAPFYIKAARSGFQSVPTTVLWTTVSPAAALLALGLWAGPGAGRARSASGYWRNPPG